MATLQLLREFLDYNPETGVFHWLKSPSRNVPAGAVVGWKNKDGYLSVQFRGKYLLLHRVAWLFVHGEWPADRIDHFNTEKTDNRIKNLRAASIGLNTQNQRKAHRQNKLGVLGVHKTGSNFTASIRVRGKTVHLGRHASPEEAHAAYVAAKRRYHEGCTL